MDEVAGANEGRCKKKELTPKEAERLDHDLRVLESFTRIYCRKKHGARKNELCGDCADFLAYAKARRIRCPLDPKPKCKECPVHCYAPKMREKAREVMRVGGMHHVLFGRIDWVWKYFLFPRRSGKA